MATSTLQADEQSIPVRPASLWFGLLGGAVAWAIHLVGVYLAAEFGCLTRFGEQRLLGVTVVVWIVLGVTLLTALLALVASTMAYRAARRLGKPRGEVAYDAAITMARSGVYASGFGLSVILFEAIPIFYYLREC